MMIQTQEQWNACAEEVNTIRTSNGIITIDASASEWIDINSLPREVHMIDIKGQSRVRIRHFSYDKRRVTVHVHDNAWLDVFGDENVFCYDRSTVFAQGLCRVEAEDQSKLYAFDACSVTAWHESAVEAWHGVTVTAFGSGDVAVHGQAAAYRYHHIPKVKYTEFARVYEVFAKNSIVTCRSYGNAITGELVNSLNFCGAELVGTISFLYVVEYGSKNVSLEIWTTYKDDAGFCTLSFQDALIAYGALNKDTTPRMLKVAVPIQSIIHNPGEYPPPQEFKAKEITVIEEVNLDETQEYLARIWAKKGGVYADLLAMKMEGNGAIVGRGKDIA